MVLLSSTRVLSPEIRGRLFFFFLPLSCLSLSDFYFSVSQILVLVKNSSWGGKQGPIMYFSHLSCSLTGKDAFRCQQTVLQRGAGHTAPGQRWWGSLPVLVFRSGSSRACFRSWQQALLPLASPCSSSRSLCSFCTLSSCIDFVCWCISVRRL